MKIVTINCPESYLDAIDKLIGEGGLFPSRSECIRCAVRDFLLKELRLAKNLPSFENELELEYEEKIVKKKRKKDQKILVPIKAEDKSERIEEKPNGESNGSFVLKTIVLGTKEEFLRSKQLIKVDEKDYHASLGSFRLDKHELEEDDDWITPDVLL